MRSPGYWIPAAASILAALLFGLLGLSLYRTSVGGARQAVAGQTAVTAAAAAAAIAATVQDDLRLAATVAGEDGLAALVQRAASQPTVNAVEFANISIQRANPQVRGLYFYNRDGSFVLSQVVNPTHRPPRRLSVACDATGTYCTDTNAPAGGYLGSAAMRASLARALRPGGVPTETLAFDRGAGPFGSLYIVQPIRASSQAVALGALVAQIDAASLFAPAVETAKSRVLVIDRAVVIDAALPGYYERGLLPVTRRDPTLSSAITGGLAQAPVGMSVPDGRAQMTIRGAQVVASRAPVPGTALQVISYAPTPAVLINLWVLLGAAACVVLLAAGVGGLSLFLRHQVRQVASSRAPAGGEAGAGAALARVEEHPQTRAHAIVALSLCDVRYTYPHSTKVALAGVSYSFPRGTTAIVGPNGAGKSTLVKLLTGLLAPTSGSIVGRLSDGACLPPEQLHKAVLFQEPSHLHLSIRQNITMRFETQPGEEARIYDALEKAGLGEVVRGLPNGIDTLVGAGFGGQIDLSGGQWQRLALARLIYQDAPVMILDEPVASLDPEGERAVFELFAQMAQDRVIIFTTHRYDSIPEDTRIVVLVDGRITESGTHDELLQQRSDYWSLYLAASPGAVRAHANGAAHARP